MNIEWTLCGERMPPDEIFIIVKGRKIYRAIGCALRISGLHGVNLNGILWTEFTKEKWEFLNR